MMMEAKEKKKGWGYSNKDKEVCSGSQKIRGETKNSDSI